MTDDAFRLDRQLCFALHATSRAVTQAYGPLLAPLGVTYPQYLVLLVLWENDHLKVGHIGELLYLDSGTLTPLLKRLEAQGVVVRQRDREDERAVVISLTAAGKNLRRRAEGIRDRVACAIGAPPRELSQLRDSLRKILLSMQTSEPTPPAKKKSARPTRKQGSR